MSENNIWEILGLESGATKKEIKRQYAKLSKECHTEEKPEEFARLHQAYQTAMKLCDNKELLEEASKEISNESLLEKISDLKESRIKEAEAKEAEAKEEKKESDETKESEKTSTPSTDSHHLFLIS